MKIYCVHSVVEYDTELIFHKLFMHKQDAMKEKHKINKRKNERAWVSIETLHQKYEIKKDGKEGG